MSITLLPKRSFFLCSCWCASYGVYDIVRYQESTALQLCHTAAAVGNTIYGRSQMTDSRQHAESTTPACDALPDYTPLPLAAAATAASGKCQVTCRRKVCGSFQYNISIQTILIFMFMLVCFVYGIVPYQESTTLQLYPTAAALGYTIDVRSQMTRQQTTCGEHSATTLPLSGSGR